MRVVIVGRGPSLRNNSFGPLIDSMFVIRLKKAVTSDKAGVRTDIVCSRSGDHEPDWLFPDCVTWDWRSHWKRFSRHPKPSTGASAVFCIKEHMPQVTEVVLAGCDYLMHPRAKHPCPEWGHDSTGEHNACAALFKLTDIKDLCG